MRSSKVVVITKRSHATASDVEQANISDITGQHVQEADTGENGAKKRRKPAELSISCPICRKPAPDHLHFGGERIYINCVGMFDIGMS